MAIEEGFFPAADHEKLFYRFQAGHSNSAPLLMIHGHGEHSGRYVKFFSELRATGRPIAVFDLRGCGRSGGRAVYVERFEEFLDDVTAFTDFLKGRYEIPPRFALLGHSLGGLIATAWALRNPESVERLVLSSPLFGIPHGRILGPITKFLNAFVPRGVLHNPVRPPFLTHDPKEVEKYKTDPLIRRRITVHLVYEMLRVASLFQKGEFAFPFPVTVLMAERDYVVDPQSTRQFFTRLKAPQKALEEFPGFYHEIFNEVEQKRAFDRLRHYI